MGFFSPRKVGKSLFRGHWSIIPIKEGEAYTFTDQGGFIPDHADLLEIIRCLCDAYDLLTPEEIYQHNNAYYEKAFGNDNRTSNPQIKKVEKPVRRPLKGYVYLVQHGNSDYYKIGMTSDCQQRMKSFQTASPEELKLVHSIKTNDMLSLELYFHELFAHCRVRGEWFELEPNEVSEFVNYEEVG